MACMCLLEVSSNGLLESELLEILADEDNLMPRVSGGGKEKGDLHTHIPMFVRLDFLHKVVLCE